VPNYTRVSPLATNEEKGNWITWEFESLRECQNRLDIITPCEGDPTGEYVKVSSL